MEVLMRLVFVDDSEQKSPRRRELGSLLGLGAVIVPEDEVADYSSDLTAIRTDLSIPPGEEIKWKPSKGSFLATAGGELASTLRRRMLEAAIAHEIRSSYSAGVRAGGSHAPVVKSWRSAWSLSMPHLAAVSR